MPLEKLTIVVPTFNRQTFALRLMRFWLNRKVIVHILDGTAQPIEKDALKDYDNTNIRYHHMPFRIEERLGKAIEFVDTPYVALSCDDEFFIPSVLERCIEFLESEKDHVACIGRALAFYPLKGDILSLPIYTEMKDYKVEQNSPEERMIAHMTRYAQTSFYSVQRLTTWRNTMALAAEIKNGFSSPYILELRIELSTVYQGKTRVIEELMWLRNRGNPPIQVKKIHDLAVTLEKWLKDPIYKSEVDFFYDSTASALSRIDNNSPERVRECIHQAIAGYLQNIKHPTFIKKVLARVLPQRIKLFLKGSKSLLIGAQEMQNEGVRVDMEQLREIVEYINS
ncbi:MAG: TIGR00180 family glycosyltransferase [Candidatus Sigynarchaeota archaeon]